MYHRPQPTIRSSALSANGSPGPKTPSPRLTPLLPSAVMTYPSSKPSMTFSLPSSPSIGAFAESTSGPTICGMPLKYLSLVTLAVQNAALSIVMHYSRVSTPSSHAYSPASAVLLSELLKGSISFIIALARVREVAEIPWHQKSLWGVLCSLPYPWTAPFWDLCGDIFSPDCWKLSIPAILYVVQNSLQFVAVSNLPVASFQVTYQMKILTTAAFSVALLRKKMTSTKWLSLFFLAIGVGIVQIQTSTIDHVASPKSTHVGSAHDSAPIHIHIMSPLKGFGAVTAACFTSGLAGVYFEMVLKNSKADLWVRNVQLSLFSLIPALIPVLYSAPPIHSRGFLLDFFRNFGAWAWATVSIQVFGGLVTAIVIKYSDNILKGFATSLSIILSSLASVALFNFKITPSFVIGSTTVLWATWMYNQPPAATEPSIVVHTGTPISSHEPILGQMSRKKTSPFQSPRALASALGLGSENGQEVYGGGFSEILDTPRYNSSPYGSPYPSRTPSRVPSRAPTPPMRLAPPSPMSSDSGHSL
ncbi:nucleotide-sugar transporter-domain-containing protein [Mycena floridula]|nr:nucleotide-sugar transporter-domain-containing protein [Mycena floridula]